MVDCCGLNNDNVWYILYVIIALAIIGSYTGFLF